MERKMKNYNELDILSLKTELNFREYSESTKKIYVQVVTNFLEATNKEAIKIKKEDVVRYLDNNLKKVKANTRGVYLNALEFFFEEVLGLDITESIKNYKREYVKKSFMSMDEFNLLVNSVSGTERLMYLIIKEAGFRTSELIRLKLSDIDYQKSLLAERKVSKELLKEIQGYCDKREIDGNIIQFTTFSLMIWVKRSNQKILGKKYTIEEIRHSIALEKYLKKGDEDGAIEYLGIKDQNKNKIRIYYKRSGNNYLEE